MYTVIYTRIAENDLREIYEYIAFELRESIVAQRQVNRIIDAIAGLDHMPERFKLYDSEPWRSKGLRVMPVNKYLVFYVPSAIYSDDMGTVTIIRIIYGGRDIDTQLNETDAEFFEA